MEARKPQPVFVVPEEAPAPDAGADDQPSSTE